MDLTEIAVAQLAITVAEPDANRRPPRMRWPRRPPRPRGSWCCRSCRFRLRFDAADPAAEARGLAAPVADSADPAPVAGAAPPGTGW